MNCALVIVPLGLNSPTPFASGALVPANIPLDTISMMASWAQKSEGTSLKDFRSVANAGTESVIAKAITKIPEKIRCSPDFIDIHAPYGI